MKRIVIFLLVLIGLVALYSVAVLNWSYSTGDRAGWVQKFSRKGWLCKTWEGEMAMVTMPGAIPEKFYFTVWNDGVAQQINQSMGRRVTLTYEQKKGLPGACFGETEYWVTGIHALEGTEPGAPPPPPAAESH